jgi:hypothetical protein
LSEVKWGMNEDNAVMEIRCSWWIIVLTVFRVILAREMLPPPVLYYCTVSIHLEFYSFEA